MLYRLALLSVVTFSIVLTAATASHAQRRDFLTDLEVELVRDNQDIDKRIDVLVKMIDRRFAAMGMEVGGWKASGKDKDLWGDARTGTRSEMLMDVRHLLQKAIDDIDNVAMHDSNMFEKDKMNGLLFPKAVRALAAASNRYLPALKTTLEKVTDERDKGLILASIEHCQEILEASAKIPAETEAERQHRLKKKG